MASEPIFMPRAPRVAVADHQPDFTKFMMALERTERWSISQTPAPSKENVSWVSSNLNFVHRIMVFMF